MSRSGFYTAGLRTGGGMIKSMSTGDLYGINGVKLDQSTQSVPRTNKSMKVVTARSPSASLESDAAASDPTGKLDPRSFKSTELSRASEPSNIFTPSNWMKNLEMRRRQKKALEKASTRRRAQLQIKPQPLTEEMQCRVQELKDAKKRYEEREGSAYTLRTKPSAARSKRIEGETKNRKSITFQRDKKEAMLDKVLCVLTGLHPSLPTTVMLPGLLLVMFLIYHFDANMLLSSLGHYPDNGTHAMFSFTPEVALNLFARVILFILVLVLYSTIHWSVTTTALVAAFDSIQLPGGANSINLESAKELYLDSVRKYTAIFTLSLAGMCTARAILLALWRNIVLHYAVKSGRFTAGLLYPIKDILLVHLKDLKSFCAASILERFVLPAAVKGVISFVWVGLGPFLKGVTVAVKKNWITSIAARVFSFCVSTVSWVLFATFKITFLIAGDFAPHYHWWQHALETTKTFMSYSAVFVVSVLLVVGAVMPKRRRVPEGAGITAVATSRLSSCDENSFGRSTASGLSSSSCISEEPTSRNPNDDRTAEDANGRSIQNSADLSSNLSRKGLGDDEILRRFASKEEIIYEDGEGSEDEAINMGDQNLQSNCKPERTLPVETSGMAVGGESKPKKKFPRRVKMLRLKVINLSKKPKT